MKLKISKTTLFLLMIGIFLVLLASLGMAYGGQRKEQSQVNQELSLAQLMLAKYSPDELSSQQKDLESQLAQIESKVQATKAQLNRSMENFQIADTLFMLAEASDVEVIEISQSAPTTGEVEGNTFSGLRHSVTIEGDVSNLISFIFELRQEFSTDVTESINISIPEGQEDEKPSASINLVIYTYKGD